MAVKGGKKNTSRIEDIIKDMEDLIETSKQSTLSPSKIVVNKEDLLVLVRELRMKAPEEIKRYRRMLDNHDAIMADAQAKADKMMEEAKMNIQNLVDEHEIVQQALQEADTIMADANAQANELLYQAKKESDMMHRGAVRYMAENLTKMQNLVDSTMNSFDARYRSMMTTMEKYSAILKENKAELLGIEEKPAQAPKAEKGVSMPAEAVNTRKGEAVKVSDADYE